MKKTAMNIWRIIYSIMIEDCAEPGKGADELLKILSSFISDKISNF